MFRRSVVVCYLDIDWTALRPGEADPVLIINSYAVLPFSLPLERFQVVAYREPQIGKPRHVLELVKLSTRSPPDRFRTAKRHACQHACSPCEGIRGSQQRESAEIAIRCPQLTHPMVETESGYPSVMYLRSLNPPCREGLT
jgi:hypothetical protein